MESVSFFVKIEIFFKIYERSKLLFITHFKSLVGVLFTWEPSILYKDQSVLCANQAHPDYQVLPFLNKHFLQLLTESKFSKVMETVTLAYSK